MVLGLVEEAEKTTPPAAQRTLSETSIFGATDTEKMTGLFALMRKGKTEVDTLSEERGRRGLSLGKGMLM